MPRARFYSGYGPTMRASLALAAAAAAWLAFPVPAHAWGANLLLATASSQAIQNERANAYHLSRMTDRAMIQRFYRAGLLLEVPDRTRTFYLDGIPAPYHYLRPWTWLFLDRLSSEYYARFGLPLRVTSLVRTVGYQLRLTHFNPNATEATGPDASSHLTGATLDISRRFMPYRAQQWMRRVLLQLERSGYLYAVEEFQEPCFHVMVFPPYRLYATRLTERSPRSAVRARRHAMRGNAAPTRPIRSEN